MKWTFSLINFLCWLIEPRSEHRTTVDIRPWIIFFFFLSDLAPVWACWSVLARSLVAAGGSSSGPKRQTQVPIRRSSSPVLSRNPRTVELLLILKLTKSFKFEYKWYLGIKSPQSIINVIWTCLKYKNLWNIFYSEKWSQTRISLLGSSASFEMIIILFFN